MQDKYKNEHGLYDYDVEKRVVWGIELSEENKNKLGLLACQNCLNTFNNSYGWDPANRTNLFLLFSRSTRISKKKSERTSA